LDHGISKGDPWRVPVRARGEQAPPKLTVDPPLAEGLAIANFPPGKQKVKIQLVNSNHEVFPGQEVTHTFTIPAHKASERAER
jgi:hypothetical protein